jgi:hypothetical protein
MKRLIGAFASGALTNATDSCLDLSIVARHRVSVGVDCPPYSRIERSIFDSGTKQIAGSLFTQAGIDLTRLDFGLIQMSALESQSWQELYLIPEFVAQSPAIGEGDFANLARLTKPRTLSSDRILMGVIASPRPVHQMSTPRTAVSENSQKNRTESIINSNYKTFHTSPLLGKDSGFINLFESLPDKSSE